MIDRVRDVQEQRDGALDEAVIGSSCGKVAQLREQRSDSVTPAASALAASVRRRSPGKRHAGSSSIAATSVSIRA